MAVYVRKPSPPIRAEFFDGTPESAERCFGLKPGAILFTEHMQTLHVETREGRVGVAAGHWIVLDDGGGVYPVAPERFVQVYEAPRMSGLTFGEALSALKDGGRVCRVGWNGKGMWLALTEGGEIDCLASHRNLRGAAAEYYALEAVPTIRLGAHIDMRAADGSLVIGWLASQTDMLAEDWMVLP